MLFLFRGAFWNAEILAPLDIPGTLYSKYAWLESGSTHPANHYTIDVFDHELPRQFLIHAAVKAGEFPWWDPYSDGGRPLAADAHVSGTDLFRLALYRVLPFVTAYNFTKIFQCYLIGLGMYLLLGALGYGRWLRTAGALSHQFAANHAFFLTPLCLPAVFLFFPFLFYAWVKYGVSRNPAWPLLMAFLVGFAMCAGNQQTHIMMVLVLAAFWIGSVCKHRSLCWKDGGILGLVFVGGCLLALPILVPQTELFLLCSRDIAGVASSRKLLTGVFSLTGLFPWSLGTFRTLDLSKLVEQSGLGFTMFAGSITGLLMLLGIPGAGRGENREAGLKVALSLVGLYFVVATTPLIYFLYTRSSDMAIMGMVVMGVEGADRLSRSAVRPGLRRGVARLALGIVLLYLAMNLVALLVVPRVAPALDQRLREREAANVAMDMAPSLRQSQVLSLATEISWRNVEMTVAVLGIGLLGWVLFRGTAPRSTGAVILAALNILPALLFSERFAVRQPMERWSRLMEGGPEQRAAIAAVGRSGRLLERSPGRLDYLFPGVTGMLFHVHTWHGYSSFILPDLANTVQKDFPEFRIAEASYTSATRGLKVGELAVGKNDDRLSRFQWLKEEGRRVSLREESLNRVVLDVSAGPAGQLIRTDRYYPGWEVLSPASVQSTIVDRVFLRMQVPAERTTIVLQYKPRFMGWTLCVAGFSAVVLFALGIWNHRTWRIRNSVWN